MYNVWECGILCFGLVDCLVLLRFVGEDGVMMKELLYV